jgi:hypothetical protein
MDTNPLECVREVLQISISDISGLYIVGSRMWGNFKITSDYDCLVILKSNLHLKSTTTTVQIRQHSVDLVCIELEHFLERVHLCRLPEIYCLLCPKSCIIKPILEISLPKTFDRKIVWESAEVEWIRDWSRAEKLIIRGDILSGKKIIAHMIRILLLFVEIAKTSDVTTIDVQSFNDIVYELQNVHEKNWDFYNEQYGPRKDLLLNELRGT